MEQSNQVVFTAILDQSQIERITKTSYITGYKDACNNFRDCVLELDKYLVDVMQKMESKLLQVDNIN